MKFDYAIGDPISYNENYTTALWPNFAKSVMDYANHSIMCFPANWLFSLNSKNATILFNNNLKSVKYIEDGHKWFYRNNNISQFTVVEQLKSFNNDSSIKVELEDGTIKYMKDKLLFMNKYEEEFYYKFISLFQTHIQPIWKSANFSKDEESVKKLYTTNELLKNPIKVLTTKQFGAGKAGRIDWYYIEKDDLNIDDNIINCKKIIFSRYSIYKKAIIINENEVCYGGYVVFIPEEDNEYHFNLLYSFLNTKCARFCLTYRTKAQRVMGFELIPNYTCFIPMLNGELITDEWIYKTFNFSEELISHIESNIKIIADKRSEEIK